jgi:hypothetical protein
VVRVTVYVCTTFRFVYEPVAALKVTGPLLYRKLLPLLTRVRKRK